MTLEEFDRLDEQSKKVFLFEADKVSERDEGLTKIQVFKIDDFFIETRRSVENPSKRYITTYSTQQIVAGYMNAENTYM